jgi:hypothetical protein
MTRLYVIFCLLPFTVWGIDRVELHQMLLATATNQGPAYLAARNAIIGMDAKVLPLLVSASHDRDLSWQQKLAARICYERMSRGDEIQALREHDWLSYPPYLPLDQLMALETSQTNSGANVQRITTRGRNSILWTPAGEMRKYVMPKCKELGLWYYYIELTWKNTGECAIFRQHKDVKFNLLWPGWCRGVLKDQPEDVWLRLAILERLQNDPTLEDRENLEFYREFLRGGCEVSILVDRFDAYFEREATGMESYQGERAKTYLRLFQPIFACADSRHADLLEKFISEHPALAELKLKVAEVRARPAPVAKAEPAFRLGTNVVAVAP